MVRETLFGPSAGDLSPARAWLLAVWFGMLLGVVEAVYVVVAHRIQPKPVWGYSSAVIWMAPIASVTIFAVLGVGAAGLLRLWPSSLRLRTAAVGFGFVVWYSLIRLSLGGVHRAAALVLAAGLAIQTGRFIFARRERFWPFSRYSLVGLAGAVVLLASILHGGAWLSGYRFAALRPPADAAAPNVLLLLLDTVRGQSLSLYGHDRLTTPNIDTYGSTAVVFEKAIAPSPWTLPSHASMFTGRHAGELSADWASKLSDRDSTVAEVLHTAGYFTAGFIGNIVYCTQEVGLDRGFAVYEDHPQSVETVIQQSWLARKIARPVRRFFGDTDLLARKSAEDVNAQFLGWLDREREGPFFAFLNYYDAHGPYLPPDPFRTRFGAGDPVAGLDPHERSHESDDLRRLEDAYDGALAYLDEQIKSLLDTLAAREVLDNTIVIITSDHGEEFGEHGIIDHGNSLYLPALHVPLIISYPSGIPSGLRIASPIELRDLAATILDLSGLSQDRLPGTSLARHWQAGSVDSGQLLQAAALSEVSQKPWNIPAWFPIARGDMQSLVVGDFHYIRNGDGREELYNLELDPWEDQDLAVTSDGSKLLPTFRDRLETHVQAPGGGAGQPAQ
jgi:arylsulfatase A-like enzyme